MPPINVVVIKQSRPGVPDCTAWLGEDQGIRIAARSSQVDDTGALCASYYPDVLLVSTYCVRDSNPGWLADVHRHCAATRIILTDDALTDDALIDCLGTGARGWVQACDAPLVGKAVHAVHLGEAWVSRKLARRLVDRLIERERGREG
jgi:DNA-binding NarL/FixJ family response regulator